ncbi:GerMN domain-containing protein [Fredinandcohnia sp. 179-A 10B2 NHS]|uniref:GerMN domain-containing protein n=1 Tax=Fredinandcohnia sp. 179-A 10B2 NHS TaxID=3235176 RepID=UPI0039A1391E
MKKSEWNDEQLEQMLMQMPTIKDHRNPREIYQNISLKVNKKKRKKVWFVPTIATAAAALLFFILAPSFLNNFNLGSESSSDEAMENASMAIEDSEKSTEEDLGNDSIGMLSEPSDKEDASRVMIAEEQQSYTVKNLDSNEILLTYSVYLGGANFPTTVSIVVQSDGDNAIEQWEKNIPLVNDIILRNPNLGIDPIPSFFSDFSEIVEKDGSKIVRADVADNVNTESFTSAQGNEFKNLLESFRLLSDDYQHVELYKNNELGVINGNEGIVEKNIDLEKDTKYAYLYYMHEESGHKFLAPSSEEYSTIKEALEAMGEPLGQGDYKLQPTIPANANLETIKPDGTNLAITFTDDTGLDNNDTFIRMLEAILLTAKEFDFETVTFHGNIDRIGDVQFGEPVDVPIAPNPLPLN